MKPQSFLKIDHPFDDSIVEELQVMRELRLNHYEKLGDDLPAAMGLLERQGISTNAFVLKQEIDQKVTELKRRISEEDQSIYLDEIELYLSSVAD